MKCKELLSGQMFRRTLCQVLPVLLTLFLSGHPALASSTWTQTTDADFSAGTKDNVVVTGTGEDGSVVLGSEVFLYKREITIDNSGGGDLTDFQVKISLHGGNFDFSKPREDGGDIRFCDPTDMTPLHYWVESWDSSGQMATVWVNVPLIEAGSTRTIHMYYGNASAGDASDGAATFDLFDDFDDLSAWS